MNAVPHWFFTFLKLNMWRRIVIPVKYVLRFYVMCVYVCVYVCVCVCVYLKFQNFKIIFLL